MNFSIGKMVRRKKVKKVKKGSLKRWLVVLGIIFICFVSAKVVFSYQKSIWKTGKLNFVLVSEPVLVVSLSPQEKSLTLIKIPKNTYVEVTRGFGLYKIESVYPLGELEGKGGELLTETVQEFLGIPVEGWIKTSSKFKVQSSKLSKEDILLLKKQITSLGIFLRPQKLLKFLKEDLETNFGFWDLAKIWLKAKKVSLGRINYIDLESSEVLTEFALPDGERGKRGDPLLIDSLLGEFFFEPKIRKEKISIEVFNGTDYPGLAEKAARMITNIGGKVIKVGDSREKIKKCQIKAADQHLKSLTFLMIKKIFASQVLKEEREDLTLIVGEDYRQKLFFREGK